MKKFIITTIAIFTIVLILYCCNEYGLFHEFKIDLNSNIDKEEIDSIIIEMNIKKGEWHCTLPGYEPIQSNESFNFESKSNYYDEHYVIKVHEGDYFGPKNQSELFRLVEIVNRSCVKIWFNESKLYNFTTYSNLFISYNSNIHTYLEQPTLLNTSGICFTGKESEINQHILDSYVTSSHYHLKIV